MSKLNELKIKLEDKIKKLEQIPIYLAEYEYVYSDTLQNNGIIDPNILSAGGYPITILGEIIDKLQEEPQLLKQINQFNDDQFNNLFPDDYEIEFKNRIIDDLSYLIDDDAKNLIKKIISGEIIINSVEYYIQTRINQIKSLINISDANINLNHYSSIFINKVIEYAYSIYTNLKFENSIVNDFYVSWESTLGYFLKYFAEKENKGLIYNVYHDLYINSGLFALTPFDLIFNNLSSKKRKYLYSYFVNKHNNKNFDKVSIKHAPENILKIFFKDGSTYEYENIFHKLKLLEENSINQYAYSFDYFPKNKFDIKKISHQHLLFSNLLNSKSAFFKIIKEMEGKYKLGLDIPETHFGICRNIIRKPGISVIKEGGYCSTGGKDVFFIKNDDNDDLNSINLNSPITQKYVNSFVFSLLNIKLHTQIRKISVIDKRKNILHLGYVCKLAYGENKNSSGYKSIYLVFDEGGGFVSGKFIGSNTRKFIKLSDEGIKLNLPEEEWKILLNKVKLNWLIATYYVNKYFQGDVIKKVNDMVDQKLIHSRFMMD